MASRSSTCPRKFGSIAGAATGSALAAVVVDDRHAEMQLDVGDVEIGTGFEKSAAFRKIGSHRSAPFAAVLHDGAKLMRDAAKRHAGEIGTVRPIGENEIRMILQVLPDAGQMMRGCDPVPGKRGAFADPGQQEQLRRLERAGG